ncbi:myelin-associated glycoprotein isoform X3 [Syngnathus scovelli]|uniref:myelin-associated glycoprotein isoform X3 n=1 Tax=Syngnathus scovelli TaxID=161590 RepID=UPI00210FD3CB|nr:sialoadhesin-like isoform X3 [Syngnathus scovelli]
MSTVNTFLLFLFFFSQVICVKASSWTIEMPSSVKGLLGSCVVIPCSFDYPNPHKAINEFTGIWLDPGNDVIYHPEGSKIKNLYQGRTELVGDVRQKNCSLKIDPLQESDQGPFHFRIEMKDVNNFSYRDKTASIQMIHTPSPVELNVTEDKTHLYVIASCSVTHSCPPSPPIILWSHFGRQLYQTRPLKNGQWEATSTLTLNLADANNTHLQCRATFRGGQQLEASRIINVKYAPVNVDVYYSANIKEGEAARFECNCDANPPASSYEWHSQDGVELHKGKVFILANISRHTGGLYCTAINAMGNAKSSPVQLNVTYPPEIKSVSSCSLEGEMVKCVCIAESRPPSNVEFFLNNTILSRPDIDWHDSITIGTLRAFLPSSDLVYCVAKNTLGSASAAITLPAQNVEGKMLYVYIILAAGAAVMLVILILLVVLIKKCSASRGSSRVASGSEHHRKPGEALENVVAARFNFHSSHFIFSYWKLSTCNKMYHLLNSCPPPRKNIKATQAQGSMYDEHIYGNAEWTINCDPVYGNV